MNFNIKSKRGFTLIELLVVIGILAVLAAIAIPSVAGLIDRANVSADKTNTSEYTNAIERFASEYELYCQDIASGTLDIDNLDSAQGRVYNVLGIVNREDVEKIEISTDETVDEYQVAIYRDTKYPANAYTAQLIVQNYAKTSSSSFEPKQSDMHYWYSPDCGVVVFAEPNADQNKDDKLNNQIISGVDAKGNTLNNDTKWIDLTKNSLGLYEYTDVSVKNWNGLTNFYGQNIWTDGTNTYYSSETNHYVLRDNTWERKTWNNLTSFYGENVWSDGKNTYYSDRYDQYVLVDDTWQTKTWSGLTNFEGRFVWKSGSKVYYSFGNSHYVLNGSIWTEKNWSGLDNFDGWNIWTDGKKMYFSDDTNNQQYVLVGNTWKTHSWNTFGNFSGYYIWRNGRKTYYTNSHGDRQYEFNGSSWTVKTWNGPTDFDGHNIWTDGTNTYYSSGTKHYVFS